MGSVIESVAEPSARPREELPDGVTFPNHFPVHYRMYRYYRHLRAAFEYREPQLQPHQSMVRKDGLILSNNEDQSLL